MPREYVVGNLDYNREFHELRESVVSVGWERGGGVQIGTISRSKISHETVNEGWFVDLDRHQCNDLIKKIRRARDQAFGRDE